jgi:hypothetical protein
MTSSYNFLNGNSYLSNKCVKQLIFTCGKFILTTVASVIIARVKITFLIPIPTSLLLYPFPSLPYLFHSFYLPSVFILYFSPLSSLISLHPFHILMLDCLSLSPHSTFYTLLVPSPWYLLSCVPFCASFPDPIFSVHLPFSLYFFHSRCLRFLHSLFLLLLKNLPFFIPSSLYSLY